MKHTIYELDGFMQSLRHLILYYDRYKHDLTEDNKKLLISQIHVIGDRARMFVNYEYQRKEENKSQNK